MALIVGCCWHSMIAVGIVAHTQEFFDMKNFHQMAELLAAHHCCNNSNYSIGSDYLLASFDAVGH